MNPDGTNQINLTNDGAGSHMPAWSPDGKKLAFVLSYRIWVMNADGTGRTSVTAVHANRADSWPSWSPDGQKIAFDACCTSPFQWHVLMTINADGTGEATIFSAAAIDADDMQPGGWSPDGTRIVFAAFVADCHDNGEVFTIAPDGSDLFNVTGTSCMTDDLMPSWSPDMQRIALVSACDLCAPYSIFTINPDGTNRQEITVPPGPNDDFRPAYSPDGTKIAFDRGARIQVMNADGTGITDLTGGTDPEWQPIPINSYPRPKGATPMLISLVPAYPPCTSANRTHGAPLAHPSCANPQLTSQSLTVGSPDANGKRTTMQASIRLRVASGDVKITALVNNVFKKDLSDYTGGLRGRLPLQITDRDNTPSPGGPGAATVQQIPFEFDFGCTATADTTIGSDCPISTAANAVVPGSVTAGLRSIWQIGQAQVYDGGADANPLTTGDNTLFLDQGIFIP
jgi:WD40 repeat protein